MPPLKGDEIERVAMLKEKNVRAAKPVVPGKPVYGGGSRAGRGRKK